MYKYIYIFFALILFLFISKAQTNAQTNSLSTYSSFGIGRIENSGFVKNQGMGGSGVALQTDNFINVLNPASLTGVDSLKMLFDFGFGSNVTSYDSKDGNGTALTGGLNNISLAFRFTPIIGSSVGVSQFSSVGYNVESSAFIEGGKGYSEIYKSYEGKGGINQVYFSNAVKISKNISFGLNLSYLFGNIKKTEYYSSSEIGGELQLDYTDFLKQVQLEPGIQYQVFTRKNIFSFGAVYSPKLKFSTSREVSTYSSSGAGINEDLDVDNYDIPTNVVLGFGWINNHGFKAAFDYRYQNWESIKYSNVVAEYQDSHKFSGGIEFRNKKTKRATPYLWQIGGYYEDTYLKVKGRAIIDRGITMGVGIPMKNNKSYLNLSLNYGNRGTSNNTLISEKYYGFSLSMSMVESWFRKSQFQ